MYLSRQRNTWTELELSGLFLRLSLRWKHPCGAQEGWGSSYHCLVSCILLFSWWRTLFLDGGEGREEHIASLPSSQENLPPPEVNCRIIWSRRPRSPGSCRCCCQGWEASGGRTSSPSLRSPSFLELGLMGSLERCCRRLGRPRTCEHIIVVLFVNLSGIHTCFPVLV